ncbi:hypothetical protein QFZ22_002518 [Streptomyces canus]|uniref:UL36 very large tegument protein n=1 Tax=Streptomyces canus TaxID=58343 RepID=A0AAW8FCJ0_9ACTN|nr:hypothetical protein [Streptomyces canus]MDQ0906533.1 hypothetical protein [Streptomyces canus]
MAVDQLPGRLREFVAYLDGLLARLDQGGGWCAVFWQRDPDGMQACLDGREVPPWDVVEALLQDLATEYGPEVAHVEAERARPLHAAAQTAHDARPGGRDALGDRFDVMLREQRYAAERQAELGRLLANATTQEEADAIRLDLAWARDDHERAVRRCAELQSRMAELDGRSLGGRGRAIRRGQVADGGVFQGAYGDRDAASGGTGGGRLADRYGGDVAGVGGNGAGGTGRGGRGQGGYGDDASGESGHGAGGAGRGLGGYGGEAAGVGGNGAGGTGGGGRGQGGYGDDASGESGYGAGGAGRGQGGYGGDVAERGGHVAGDTGVRGREAGHYGDAGTGFGGHESGARGADGRSADFPNMPQQRDTTSTTGTEATRGGPVEQWPDPAEAARSGHAPQGSASAGVTGPGRAPRWSGAAEEARPGHAVQGSAAAGLDGPGRAPRWSGAAEAPRSGHAPQGSAPAGEDGAGHPPQGSTPAEVDGAGRAPLWSGSADAVRAGRTPPWSAPAEVDGAGRAPQWSSSAEAARAGYSPHPADASRPGPHQHSEADAAHTTYAPYQQAPPAVTRTGRTPRPGAETPQQPTPAAQPPEAPAPTNKRKRRRGSARFAGMAEEGGAPVVVPPAAVPDLPTGPVSTGRSLRGARFAGAAEEAKERSEQRAESLDAAARRETADTVATLTRLRAEGRTGEAHALLAEVAHWPADRFPLIAAELQHAGLRADWASLLWEAASLPADRLVAAADALVAAGRGADGEQVLRQGVARPAGEIGAAVLGLVAEGRHREVSALLDAYVRVRTPEEAARSAEPGPQTLVPLLLAAARGVSDERHWDLVHALRVAGFSA